MIVAACPFAPANTCRNRTISSNYGPKYINNSKIENAQLAFCLTGMPAIVSGNRSGWCAHVQNRAIGITQQHTPLAVRHVSGLLDDRSLGGH